ncbi:MAG: hypothetical protein CMA95_00540 [Euryarchaeota archaeon]|nr:hypothetical protein [Euryarchaeota archaeon]|tara:strand:+ start:2434 stop:2895 length:462 start_codon:yes stop_codon:yes gene_type:complete
MAEKIDIKKTVLNKAQYPKIINTKFSELGVNSITDIIEETPTVESFFKLYDELFYDIPALGDKNSHEYIVKTSGEYISFDQDSEIIKALQEEISLLREENLQLQMKSAGVEQIKIPSLSGSESSDASVTTSTTTTSTSTSAPSGGSGGGYSSY